MAGISGYYFVGGAGGFDGSDGLNGKDFEVEIWEGDRRTLRVNYLTDYYQPISTCFKCFVPKGPDDPDQAREALILFASNIFEDCPSFEKVKIECEGLEDMDLSSGYNVPRHFDALLEESKQIDLTERVNIYFAPLRDVQL